MRLFPLAALVFALTSGGCGPDESVLGKPAPPKPLESWAEGGYRPSRAGAALSSDARLQRAEDLMQHDRLAEAAAEYRELLSKDPKDVAALVGLSRVAGRMGDASSSLTFISRAVDLRAEDAALVNELAVALVSNGRRKEAAKGFERANALSPKDPSVLINASLNWADLNDWGSAQQCAQRAADLIPNDLYPWLLMGRFQVRQGKNAEAVPYLREAARRGPDNALVHYHLGKALVAAGQRSEAVEPLRIVLRGNLPAEIRKEVEGLLAGR
jgi:Flp pilus assembly protein TadD